MHDSQPIKGIGDQPRVHGELGSAARSVGYMCYASLSVFSSQRLSLETHKMTFEATA